MFQSLFAEAVHCVSGSCLFGWLINLVTSSIRFCPCMTISIREKKLTCVFSKVSTFQGLISVSVTFRREVSEARDSVGTRGGTAARCVT